MIDRNHVMPDGQVIVLSDKAAVIANTPASMEVVEDIYSIHERRAWVIVATAANCEKKVADDLAAGPKAITLIPTETEYVARKELRWVKGKRGRASGWRPKTVRKPVERRRFPGYLFTQLPLDQRERFPDRAQSIILHVDGVRGILGGVSGPIAIRDDEMARVRAGEKCPTVEMLIALKIGETVRVADGPFASFDGIVEEIDDGRRRLKVSVSLFGRSTSVELELDQVERIC